MNLRKHWKNLLLTITAFLWASCTSESTTQPLYGAVCPPEGCGNPGVESSSSDAAESSSSDALANSSSEAETSSSSEINAPSSSSVVESSSSAKGLKIDKVINMMDGVEVIPDSCEPNREGYNPAYPYKNQNAKGAIRSKIQSIISNDSVSAESKDCLKDILTQIQQSAMLYGVSPHIVIDVKCSDGTTYNSKATKELAEMLGITEEEFVKRSEELDKANDEAQQQLEQKINECLDPKQPSSSSSEVTCAPGDSTVSYYPPSYSADIAKMNAEEKAKHASVSKIDSISNTLQTVPQCLADLRQELDMFVALYGAPNNITKDEVCSDGTTRPTQEYLNYLKMKEEWEKNKPALDEECQKIFEDKLKEIEQTVKECLATSDPNTDLTVCDFDAMCPEYGVDSKCTYKYTCNDGVTCRRTQGNTNMDCTDKQGEKFTNTQREFDKKYYTKENY